MIRREGYRGILIGRLRFVRIAMFRLQWEEIIALRQRSSKLIGWRDCPLSLPRREGL